jgi:ABC-2 type transport system permease protein
MMSTLEEKENRISEMILTSISAKTLIIGKIISLIALGFLQVFILVAPMIIMYLVSGGVSISNINIGDILPNIVFDPVTIVYTILLLIASYILFTGLCVMVGVLMPTAKEAGGFMGVVMMLVIAPFIFMSLFIAPEPSVVVKFLSFFPFSAPVALSMRNAFGTLSTPEAITGLVIIIASAIAIITLAIKLFRTGVMSYNAPAVNFKRLFVKKK